VVAEAIFAGKKIKKLALEPAAALASNLAEFLEFTKHRFVSECPSDAGHGYGQDKEGENLLVQGHAIRCRKSTLVCNPEYSSTDPDEQVRARSCAQWLPDNAPLRLLSLKKRYRSREDRRMLARL